MSALPAGPHELTREWLSEALGGPPVREFAVRPLGEGAGLVGLVCGVELHYAGEPRDAPRSVIAKFPSPSPENRAVGEMFDMYGREVRFYQTLAERTPTAKPACFYAALDPASGDFVLLLEDLSARRLGDQIAGCSLREARLAIEQMSRLHATWWGAESEAAELAWVPVHANPAQSTGMTQGFHAGWPVVLESFRDLVPPELAGPAARVGDAIDALLQCMCEPPLAVVHGDFRLDNMFFGRAPEEPPLALVDWQAISKSCGAQDLAYFLTQNLEVDVRRAHEDELVRSYWARLCELGVRDYALERCWRDYRLSALYLLSYAVVIAGTLDLSNQRGVRLARVLLERSLHALRDLDAFALLP